MSGGGNGYDPAALGGQFGNKLSSYLNTDAPGMGTTTSDALQTLFKGSLNQPFANGVNGALSSIGDVAAGKSLNYQDPYFQANLDKTLSDTRGDVMSSLGGSGNLNSDLQINELTKALGSVRDTAYTNERQYQDARQAQAIPLLGQTFGLSQIPGQTQLAVGQAFDANADPNYQRFLELLGGFNSSQNSAGMKEQTPWWQTALGLGIGAAGLFL